MSKLSKELKPSVVQFEVKGYHIRAFAFSQHDPNNLKTAKLAVMYHLTGIAPDGKSILISQMPEHQNVKFELRDEGSIEKDQHLSHWLAESGDPDDLFDFNYHDVQRAVENDIKARFGYEV